MNIAEIISFTLFITVFTSVVIFSITSAKYKKRKLPPGPRKLPVIGNLHQLGKLPHRTLKDLAKKHGDLMFLQLGSVPTLVVSSPDAAREIFRNHDVAFSGRPNLSINKVFYEDKSISVAQYGDYWREMRKILVLELMTTKRVQSFAEARAQGVALMIDAIARSAASKEPVNLSSLAFSLSNNLVCEVALGLKSGVDEEKSRKFQELLHVVQHLAGEVNLGDYFPWLAWVSKISGRDRVLDKSCKDMDEFFDVVIKEHVDRAKRLKTEEEDDVGDEHEDIVDVLLRVKKDPNQTSVAFTNEQLKGVLADIFIAGTDTSAATIEWTMSELMRNPKIRHKAQQELRQLARGSLVQESELSNLTYLKQVIKESFRLHPPAPLLVPRETTEKCTITLNENEAYEIPEKTRVLFNASAIQSDERYYEDPEEFWPDRFDDGKIDYRGQSFELLPFGSGRRSCPGINFATPLVELALANLLYRFDWEFPEGVTGESLDMEEALGVTMHRNTPLVLMASTRE